MSERPYDFGPWTHDAGHPPHTPDHPLHVAAWAVNCFGRCPDGGGLTPDELDRAAHAMAMVQAAAIVPTVAQARALLCEAHALIRC